MTFEPKVFRASPYDTLNPAYQKEQTSIPVESNSKKNAARVAIRVFGNHHGNAVKVWSEGRPDNWAIYKK